MVPISETNVWNISLAKGIQVIPLRYSSTTFPTRCVIYTLLVTVLPWLHITIVTHTNIILFTSFFIVNFFHLAAINKIILIINIENQYIQ